MRRIKRIAAGTARFGALNGLIAATFAYWLSRDATAALAFGLLFGSVESLVFFINSALERRTRRIAS